jgi:hypothetical protein
VSDIDSHSDRESRANWSRWAEPNCHLFNGAAEADADIAMILPMIPADDSEAIPMRPFALIISLMAGTTSLTMGQSTPAIPWANKFFVQENTPAVIAHDFGTVPQGTLLTHTMTITNIYDVPMQVIDVRKSCTCLDVTLPTKVLQPHETAEIVFQMNTAKFSGANTQSFFLTFGPQYVSTAVIRVSAHSRADVTLTPGTANFGVVALGAKPSQTVSVKYSGKLKDWKITGVVPTTGPIDVQLKENGRAGILGLGNPEFSIVVTLKDNTPVGPISETITLKTSDPTAATFSIPVTGTVQAPVTVSPNVARFDNARLGIPAEQKIMLRATQPFKVQSMPDNADGLSIEAFPTAAPVTIVTLRYTPKSVGKLSKSLTVLTELGPVILSVEGFVAEK